MIEVILIAILAVIVYIRVQPVKGVRYMPTNELKIELVQTNAQLLDVRNPLEYKNNHLEEFKNIPLYQLPNRLDELDQAREVIVICASGNRSERACRLLLNKGFQQVTNVKGGMRAWK